jgi:hypothetical protein
VETLALGIVLFLKLRSRFQLEAGSANVVLER